MMRRRLGESDLMVPPICLGGNVFGWTADEAKSFRILDRAVERGMNFIDTADVYTYWAPGNKGGESETIIGRWMVARRNRHSVIIATKVGSKMSEEKRGLAARYIKQAMEDSLQRLQTDYIDLYQSHREDPRTPLEESLTAFGDLIKEGKIRAIGASNQSVERLKEALDLHAHKGLPKYASVQPEHNLYDRAGFEAEVAGICTANRIGAITYYALASGFLSGKYRTREEIEASARKKELEKYMNDRGFAIVATLQKIATAHGVTPSAVALAWSKAQLAVTAPIASASTDAQVDQLAVALELELSPSEIQTLGDVSRQT